jgi:hypothetical protein
MDYKTTSGVARRLERSEAWVRKLADSGTLPVAARLPDGTRLFDPAVVERVARELGAAAREQAEGVST